MEAMSKFELEVCVRMPHQILFKLHSNITLCRTKIERIKEHYRSKGKLKLAAIVEERIIRYDENIDTLEVAMLRKEADLFQMLPNGIESICLN